MPDDEPKTRTSLNISQSLHTKLLHAKIDEKRDMGAIVDDALRAYFKKQESARK